MTTRTRAWLCIALAVLTAGAAIAEEDASVSVRTRPDVTRAGAPFNIIVTTMGTPLGSISLPTIENIEIDPSPAGTTNTFVYRDGRIIVSMETRFVAVALEPGNYTIPPIHAEIAGRELASEEVEIEVLAQDAPPAADEQPPEERGIPLADAFFIQTEVDKTEVYQGQAINMALSLWRVDGVQASTRRGSAVRPPDTTGFYSIDLPPAGEFRQRVVDGVSYRYEVRQTRRLLFPTATGELTIGAWNLEGEVRVPDRASVFSAATRRQVVAMNADPVTIHVKPLPPRPPGFSGAVGDFRMDTRLSSPATYLGQPVQYTVIVKGAGNPDAISAPRLPEIDGVHVSSARATTNLNRGDARLRVEKSFEYTLTPNQLGEFRIPPIPFVYFDPSESEYITLEGRAYEVRVGRPATDAARTFVAAGDMDPEHFEALGEDIAPPVDAPADLRRASGFGGALFALAYAMPVVGYAGIAAFFLRRRRFERDNALARSHNARSRMEQRLRGIPQSSEPAVELYRALCGYVADRLDAPEAGMTPDDLRALCVERALPIAAVEGVEKTLRACERVRYSGGQLSVEEVQALLEAAEVHIGQFDAALKEAKSA